MSGQGHDPAALPPWKEPLVPIDSWLDGHQSRSGRNSEEKKIPAPPGIEP
jgi:hypothetical protein